MRKRYKTVIKELASLGIGMNAIDQDGLTALDIVATVPAGDSRRTSAITALA